MFKVLIADDEMTIRRGLSTIIDWEKLKCSILWEAVDGVDALDKIRETPPDIVITDIRMPGMDGLEVARYISENYPEIKVIILTGYADFEYAQAAIKYGVIDFVLKPTDISSMENAVNRAVSILESKIEHNRLIEKLSTANANHLSDIREKLITDCINMILTEPGAILQAMKDLSMESSPFFFILGELEWNMGFELAGSLSKTPKRQNDILKNIMDLSFKDFTHWCVILDTSHCCIIVLSKYESPAEDIKEISASCQDIMDVFENSYDLHIALGISERFQAPGAFRKAYEQSVSALSHHFPGDNRTYLYWDEPSGDLMEINSIQNIIEGIISSVKLRKFEAFNENINELFSRMAEAKSSVEQMREIAVFIASSLIQLMPDKLLNGDNTGSENSSIFARILRTLNPSTLKSLLCQIAGHICSQLQMSVSQNNIIVSGVNEFIAKNYQKNIHLAAVANHAHVSSGYLSRLYRQETGCTLTEAISKFRIEKAKELLQNPQIKAYEAAGMVGIEDPAYFSLMFKRYVGCSPTEYRQLSNRIGKP